MENRNTKLENNKYIIPCEKCVLLPKCLSKFSSLSFIAYLKKYYETKIKNNPDEEITFSSSYFSVTPFRLTIHFSVYHTPYNSIFRSSAMVKKLHFSIAVC